MASPARHPAREPERLVRERVDAALPEGARAYANVRWLAPVRPGGPARDGEIDLLIVSPAQGLLVGRRAADPFPRSDDRGTIETGMHSPYPDVFVEDLDHLPDDLRGDERSADQVRDATIELVARTCGRSQRTVQR